MSSDIAIKVENLSKCYQIYDQPSDRLKQFILPPLQRLFFISQKRYYHEFWALKDINFEVRKGETVGIIGRNGSGKSTLLQLICGTLSSTSGSIKTVGRIAALLELGSGFNPDFTGRENIYLNARILGLGKDEVDSIFQLIIDFADIGDFLDQPIKTYSSGMIIRLAFSVAIHSNPKVLIVDEALSVGDELFQRRCFSRIEAIKKNGTTILFVSHSASQIIELCERAILLDCGEQLLFGLPKEVVGKYQKLLYAPLEKASSVREQILRRSDLNECFDELPSLDSVKSHSVYHARSNAQDREEEFFDESIELHNAKTMLQYESLGAWIDSPMILTQSGKRVNCLVRGKKYKFLYRVKFNEGATNVRFSMLIKTISGMELGGAMSESTFNKGLSFIEPGTCINVEFTFSCNLNPNVYFCNAGVLGMRGQEETYLHRVLDLATFKVLFVESNISTAPVDFLCVPKIEICN
ncbi:ABC transporter ATP-binding protein [Polynucleobacter sp. HIN6]|uniref:ABC transporter ATP-binding protein n=1 Tax=Polynucleobacter sp. HIN6 TaxID=3047865 RepID=UPI0025725D73|nr:ABC transporter ATP-binding protein [Polynucleobacter sp. HIN6]BEI34784.1 ABC transporter ATP-binding protein [Polynucleobacter sp. HIN6]